MSLLGEVEALGNLGRRLAGRHASSSASAMAAVEIFLAWPPRPRLRAAPISRVISPLTGPRAASSCRQSPAPIRATPPHAAWSVRAPLRPGGRAVRRPRSASVSKMRCGLSKKISVALSAGELRRSSRLPLARFLRQEAEEGEAVGGQARQGQRRENGRRAGAGGDRDARPHCFRHQPVARIGDQRHAGIADQRDGWRRRLSRARMRGPHLCRIVLVIGRQPRADGDSVQAASPWCACLRRARCRRRQALPGRASVMSPRLPMGVATIYSPGAERSASKPAAPML